MEIEEIKNLEKNEEVLINGIMVALTHELYKNTAYICYYDMINEISDLNDCLGIYLNKEWPELNYGDILQIQGKIDHLKNYSRLKITNSENIIPIDKNISFNPIEYYIEEINEEIVDSLISVSGQINKLNKKSFYIIDGENELKIKINNDQIKLDNLSKNDFIIANGLLARYGDDLILIPRNQNDLIKTDIPESGEEIKIATSTTITNLEEKENESNTTNWLLGSGIVTSLGFIFKNKFIQLFKK